MLYIVRLFVVTLPTYGTLLPISETQTQKERQASNMSGCPGVFGQYFLTRNKVEVSRPRKAVARWKVQYCAPGVLE